MGFFSFFARAIEEPDFDYPQKVSSQALKQIKSAQKSGDGQMLVDALVRFSIAKSQISKETMDTIITQIETVKKKENRADYKALLNYFEALVFKSYRNAYNRYGRKNAVNEEKPGDYTEWDNAQFESKVSELIMESVKDKDALLQCPIGRYDKIIINADEMGKIYIPTLYQFLCMKGIELTDGNFAAPVKHALTKLWVESCAEGSPEWIYAMCETDQVKDEFEAYKKYKDSEHSAMFLVQTYKRDHYNDFREYVTRFPNSYYTPEIRNIISGLEKQELNVNYPQHLSSTDSVPLSVRYSNVNKAQARVYRFPDKLLEDMKNGDVKKCELKDLQLVRTVELHCDGMVPFNDYKKLSLEPLPYGRYFITVAFTDNEGGERVDNNVDPPLIVHDMTTFNVGGEGIDDKAFAVDMHNGAPIAGATMKYEGTYNRQKYYSEAITGKDGSTLVPNDRSYNTRSVTAIKGNDKYGPSYGYYTFSSNSGNTSTSARVFTDLDIYRPGETIKFAALLHIITSEAMRPLDNKNVRVIFSDPNGQRIDTVETVSDEFGRIEGEFKIPTDRMNGRFRMSFFTGDKYREYLADKSVNVSEYKTPTFSVSFPDARQVFTRNQPVKITGKAMTYSGMPVPNAQVKLRLYRNEWSWWWRWSENTGTNITDTVVNTNEKGEFTMEFQVGLFKENEAKYYYYNYVLEAQCTNEAGESQEAKHRFIIGSRRGVTLGGDFDHCNSKPAKLPLTFNSTDENEKSVMCYYQVEDEKEQVVATGTISSDDPIVDLTKLPSGVYKIRVNMLGDDEKTSCYVRLYRPGESTSPMKGNPLWIPSDGRTVDSNNVAHITIGNSTPEANIYYIACSRDKVEKEGWLKLKQGINDFTIAVPNTPGGFLDIRFYSVSNNEVFQENVRVNSNVKSKALKVKVNSFRDKLISGAPEKWSFTLIDENDKPLRGAMVLEMMDKAINDISPNTWSFSPRLHSKNVMDFDYARLFGTNYSSTSWQRRNLSTRSAELPEFNTYDEPLFVADYDDYMLLGAAAGGAVLYEAAPMPRMAKNASMRADAEVEMEEAMIQDASAEEEVEVDEKKLDNVKMRLADVKVALWKPMLVSDAQGNVSLEFDAPEFNTTWIMQAIAYNNELLTDKLQREVLTNKPVMVKSSLPRFLRQGDSAQLAASLQNSTDEALDCDAVIELFNPRTGDIIERKAFKENIVANGTNTLKINWEVPDTVPFVGFRIKAATGDFGDGEQVMVPVLPAISPVIESKPFYLDAATKSFTTQLPQFTKDARVTLEYCDNPVWYCVQALPTIYSDNYNIATTLVHSLFAETLAQGIAKSQPNIKEAVDYWMSNKQDSSLVSMLERNSDLKIGTLLASPWVREADKQSLRMSKLNELFDEQLMEAEHKRIVDALERLQMPDGGFPWYRYPGCSSSLYTTETVLEIIGELRHLGYLKDDSRINDMVKPALVYFDKEYLKIYKEHLKDNKNNHSGFSDYVYVRTLYPEYAISSENQKMIKNCLKAMTKDWKGTSLGNKAFYAITLNRNNYQKVAKDIVESIRQFALTKPETGMYWDNVQAGWRYLDKVAVTSTILEAMNEVDPRTAEIDQIRKWMLLMKQTNDWGSSSLAADAVYALLATGNKWLERNDVPTITIDGTPVEFDKVDAYLGYCRKEIPATSLATLNIERNGASPAWGAVYSQFKAEMSEIQEVSVYDLSIHKEFYVYQTDGSLKKMENFKVGDKVQVRTIIKNAKDLDFVTVKDERGSCFEPVDKISGYRYADRTCYYLEIKDSETNMFFTSLDKGTHIISYDVYVTAPGKYSVGIATAQCQYAPQVTAHSAGSIATVE